MNSPDWVIIALGSNQGDARQNILRALPRLQAFSDHPIRASTLWETAPVDCPPGSPSFINAIALLQPHAGETPESLLDKLQQLEREFGRRPKMVPNEPRPLDLDLIAFGKETRSTPQLVLPHPRAHLREFVLGPLAEVAPTLIMPKQGRTISELLAALKQAKRPGD
jgi:2-amino-4-hydroxy-6-hydroxymethyldihydropteridine diphosphokinase